MALVGSTAATIGAQAHDRGTSVARHDESGKPLILGHEPTTVKLELDEALRNSVAAVVRPDIPEESSTPLVLHVSGLHPSHKGWRGGHVFLNLPDDPKKLDAELMSTRSPYYLGSFAFFPVTGPQATFPFRPGPTLRRLAKRHELDPARPLRVTLIGIPRQGDGKNVPPPETGVPFSEVALRIASPADSGSR
jgi:hypothetical protein